MERYLVYDPGCSVCNNIAATIQEAVGDKLQAVSIRDPWTMSLLDRAFPRGWKFAPYLMTIDQDGVRAWTGVGLAMRLGLLLGPRKAFRVLSMLPRYQPVSELEGGVRGISRRNALKLSGAVAAALVAVGLRAPIAQGACCQCECSNCFNTDEYRCVYEPSRCGVPPHCALYRKWVCLDDCFNYCGGTPSWTFWGCGGCDPCS